MEGVVVVLEELVRSIEKFVNIVQPDEDTALRLVMIDERGPSVYPFTSEIEQRDLYTVIV